MHTASAASPVAVRTDHKVIAANVANKLNCNNIVDRSAVNISAVNSSALLTCLQATPLQDLVSANGIAMVRQDHFFLIFLINRSFFLPFDTPLQLQKVIQHQETN